MIYGVNMLSSVPVRADGSEKSEIVTFLLYGELVHLLEEKGDWRYVETEFDKYKGWINRKQFFSIEETAYEALLNDRNKIVIDAPLVKLREISSNVSFFIPMGSVLYDYANSKCTLLDKEYLVENYEHKALQSSVDNVLVLAKEFLNTPYLWGGKTIIGIDCSGFTQTVFKVLGIDLPRDAYQQALLGREVSLESVQKADLAFFKNNEGRITHVGIMLGEGLIIHASGRVRIDVIDEKGIFSSEEKSYSHTLHSIKRII